MKSREEEFLEVLDKLDAEARARSSTSKAVHSTRRISRALTVQHKRIRYTILGHTEPKTLIGRELDVFELADDSVDLRIDGQSLRFTTLAV